MRTEYYRNLYQNPQIRLCWFMPMISRAEQTGEEVTTREPIPLRGVGYTFYFKPRVTAAIGSISLTLVWEDEGEQRSQTIQIVRRRSNLVSGSFVYYFLCPFGYKAKKLFYVGSIFRSRRSFGHRYEGQNISRRQRVIALLNAKEPYKRYGKKYYQGRLTPYGKRCIKYEVKQDRGLAAFGEIVSRLDKQVTNLNRK